MQKTIFIITLCVISELLSVKHCYMSLLGKHSQAFDPFRDVTEGPCMHINHG